MTAKRRKQLLSIRGIMKVYIMKKVFIKRVSNIHFLIVLCALIGMGILLRSPLISIVNNFNKPSEQSFQAPGRDWPSEKKIEDYFVEHLRMTEKDLQLYKNRL